MSASHKKKPIKEGKDKRQSYQQKADKAEKSLRSAGITAAVIVVLLLIAMFINSSNMLYTTLPALTVGDTSYSAAEYSFFYKLSYNNFVNQYGSYLQMMGLDTSKSLSSQQYTEDQTWAEYFLEQAQTSIKENTALYDDAMKNGFTLSDEDKASLNSAIESFKTGYAQAGFKNADEYVASIYGTGCNMKTVSALIEKIFIADGYSKQKNDSLTYTSDQLKKYYSDNKNDLDSYTYIAYYVDGAVKEESAADTTADSASPDAASASPSASPDAEAAKAASMDAAKSIADSIVKDGVTLEAFKAAVTAISQTETTESTTQGSSLNEKYAEWMKDSSRKAGDTTVDEADTGYYAVYYVARASAEYSTVNVRHILIKAVAAEDGTYTDEAKATAKQKAEDLLAQWKAGAATEDSFAELANSNSEDSGSNTNGGLYENVQKGKMVAEFNDWCFAEDRKIGDTGIVFNEDSNYCGYHVMYYVGDGKLNSDVLSEDSLRNKDFTDWKDALFKNYEVKPGIAAKFVK